MRDITIVALTAALLWGAPAQAEMRAVELLWNCEGRAKAPDGGVLFCLGYVSGFYAGVNVAKGLPGSTLFCAPEKGVTRDQGMRVFKKWANDNPEVLHRPARLVLFLAYVDAFPCEE